MRYAGAPCRRRAVPRSKAPGPFPAIERIRPKGFRFGSEGFRFDSVARRELLGLLPDRLRQVSVPEQIKQKALELHAQQPRTLADLILLDTEKLISDHRASETAIGSKPIAPAQVRAAIHKLRAALKPFVAGWVDDVTADLIPADLDERLASRELALDGKRILLSKQSLDYLCQQIGDLLTEIAKEFEIFFEEREKLKYVVAALAYAGIESSFSKENPARFATRVFPKIRNLI
jgi:hypothetical protein